MKGARRQLIALLWKLFTGRLVTLTAPCWDVDADQELAKCASLSPVLSGHLSLSSLSPPLIELSSPQLNDCPAFYRLNISLLWTYYLFYPFSFNQDWDLTSRTWSSRINVKVWHRWHVNMFTMLTEQFLISHDSMTKVVKFQCQAQIEICFSPNVHLVHLITSFQLKKVDLWVGGGLTHYIPSG